MQTCAGTGAEGNRFVRAGREYSGTARGCASLSWPGVEATRASDTVGACFVFEHPADPNGKDFAALKDGLRGRFGEFWKKGLLGCRELARGEMLRWISGNEGQWKKSAACGLVWKALYALHIRRILEEGKPS